MSAADEHFYAIGNRPRVQVGQRLRCHVCEQRHEVMDSEPPGILWYRCKGTTYLVAIDGRDIRADFRKSPE